MTSTGKKMLKLFLFLSVIGANGTFLARPAASQAYGDCPNGQSGHDCYDDTCYGTFGPFQCCRAHPDLDCDA